MRLTDVAHLRLPFGRLMGYDLTPGVPGAALPLSFDQRRHLGAGDRPGSWMALTFTHPGPVDLEDLARAWRGVIARHGELRTAAVPDAQGRPQLHELPLGPGGWVEHEVGPGQAVHAALGDVLDAHCRPYAQPSHRLCAVLTADGPTLVIASDHAHVDMWSMLVIARDLLALLGSPRALADAAPPAFTEHTAALEARPPAPAEIRERWSQVLAASGDVMPRFPLPLGDGERHPARVEVRDVLDVAGSEAYSRRAAGHEVSTLALTVAAMTGVTRDLAAAPLRAVLPVHSRHDAAWHDSVGWFITNSVLESTDPDPRAASAAVKEAITLGSWPLADLLAPWGGMPEAPGMFAISWLDLRRLPVRFDSVGLSAQYVSAQIHTDGVMIWFSLDEGGLHLRCRYPDTLTARENVGGWLDALVARMRELADSPTP